MTAPPGDGDGDFDQGGVTPVGAAGRRTRSPRALRYMGPFPVVRIRGELARGGARVRCCG